MNVHLMGGRLNLLFCGGGGEGVMLCPTESVTAQAMYDGRNRC
jgi:hypothetical protein